MLIMFPKTGEDLIYFDTKLITKESGLKKRWRKKPLIYLGSYQILTEIYA